MLTNATNTHVYCFGSFEFDPQSGELRKKGFRVRLEGQPIAILRILLERRGELVTREEIQKRLWTDDTFVDFEQSLNAAIRRLRSALDDSADSPQYVETLARRGYRWIAPLNDRAATPAQESEVAAPPEAKPKRVLKTTIAAAAFLVLGGLIAAVVLFRAGHPPVPPGRLLIAVAPLHNLSGDPDQNYFAEGLTEEIITQLGQLSPERIGVMRYRTPGPSVEAADSSRGPAFQYLLEGSVRRQDGTVRISTRLIRMPDQAALWTESFDRNVSDVLSLQSEIARRIGHELQINVLGRAASRPVQPEVVETYLRGRFELTRDAGSIPDAARAHFERAIALDPTYAPAHAGLADFCVARAIGNDKGSEEYWQLATQHATKALALEKDSAETHVSLAMIELMHNWNWTAAREHALRALELNPSLPEAHSVYALYLRVAGDIPGDLKQREQAVAADPYREDLKEKLKFERYFAREHESSVAEARKTLERDPQNVEAHYTLCFELSRLKKYDEAGAECVKELLLEGHSDWAAGYSAEFARKGYDAANVWVAKKRLAEALSRPPSDLWDLANLYMAAGMRGETFQTLFRSVPTHEPGLLQIRVDPDFDAIRDDPRYAELVRRIGFPNPAADPPHREQ